MKSLRIALFTVLTTLTPTLLWAQTLATTPTTKQLVPCTGTDCTWCHVILLISNIVEYLIYFSITAAAMSFAYAGFLLITNNGDRNRVTRATRVFRWVAIGFLVVVSSWFLVDTIMQALAPNLGTRWNRIDGCSAVSERYNTAPSSPTQTPQPIIVYPSAEYAAEEWANFFANPGDTFFPQ